MAKPAGSRLTPGDVDDFDGGTFMSGIGEAELGPWPPLSVRNSDRCS